jgi:hypothetical protein
MILSGIELPVGLSPIARARRIAIEGLESGTLLQVDGDQVKPALELLTKQDLGDGGKD